MTPDRHHPARLPDRSRRQLLLAAAAAVTSSSPRLAGAALPPVGWLSPRPAAPDAVLLDTAGQAESLRQRVAGRATAVQLMFTGCTSTCSTQGLLFARMAAQLEAAGIPVAWLSISIDALGDDPARLGAWLQRMGARRSWSAAVPSVRDVDALAQFLRGGAPKPGTHTNQVFVFDRQARLAYRTGDDPSPDFLQALLTQLV